MALVGHISGSSQSNSVIGISGSVIIANRPNSLFPALPGSDVTLFVSGSTDDTATSAFGGKLVVSGGLKTTTVSGSGNFDVGGELRVAGDIRVDGNDIKSSTGATAITLSGQNVVIPGDLTVNGTTATINTQNLEIKDAIIGLGFASGSVAQAVGDRAVIFGLAAESNVSLLWDESDNEFSVCRTDDTPTVTGNLTIASYSQFHASTLTGSLVKASALTGSLTKLIDGTDYLRAGSNIAITTGSSGQVTIAVTGIAGGDVVGPASATNDAIAVYDGTTGKLIKNSNLLVGTRTSTQAVVTASINLADYGLALIPNGTGSLMATAPDDTATGGNRRGANAVDFQVSKTLATQVASGDYSFIGGGRGNTASSTGAFVGAGNLNVSSGSYSAIVGGQYNSSSADYTFVGGGQYNTGSGTYSSVVGGLRNLASGVRSHVGGGQFNTGSGISSVVGGGEYNIASANYSVVCGGGDGTSLGKNQAQGASSFLGGGQYNRVASNSGVIGGGNSNTITTGFYNAIVGGATNSVSANAAFIGAGYDNTSSGQSAFIGAGRYNIASGEKAVVAGGGGDTAPFGNKAQGVNSAILGGAANIASADYTFVGGGQYNTGSGVYSSVIGGLNNTAQSYGETSLGLYATSGSGNVSSYVSTDRLLSIGNGTSASARSNALTLIKNGDMHLSGTLTLMSGSTSGITFPSTRGSNGQVLTSDGAGLITWQTPTSSPTYFLSTTVGSLYTTGAVAFIGNEAGVDAPSDKGSDVFFYVSGSTDMSASSNALFGGSLIVSGALLAGMDVALGDSTSRTIALNGKIITDVLPDSDMQYNLGSPSNRWANVYTGDLHLRNDRGNWTVIEEDEYLSIRNNKTGKMFKFVLEPV